MRILSRASFLSLLAVLLSPHAGFGAPRGARDFSMDFTAIPWLHADKVSFDVPSVGGGREIWPRRFSRPESPYRLAYYQEDNFDRVMNAMRANDGEFASVIPGLEKLSSQGCLHRAEVSFGELVIDVYFDRVDPALGDIITINKPRMFFIYERSPSGSGSFSGGALIGPEGEPEKPADEETMKELFQSVKKIFNFISPNDPEFQRKGLLHFKVFPESL